MRRVLTPGGGWHTRFDDDDDDVEERGGRAGHADADDEVQPQGRLCGAFDDAADGEGEGEGEASDDNDNGEASPESLTCGICGALGHEAASCPSCTSATLAKVRRLLKRSVPRSSAELDDDDGLLRHVRHLVALAHELHVLHDSTARSDRRLGPLRDRGETFRLRLQVRNTAKRSKGTHGAAPWPVLLKLETRDPPRPPTPAAPAPAPVTPAATAPPTTTTATTTTTTPPESGRLGKRRIQELSNSLEQELFFRGAGDAIDTARILDDLCARPATRQLPTVRASESDEHVRVALAILNQLRFVLG